MNPGHASPLPLDPRLASHGSGQLRGGPYDPAGAPAPGQDPRRWWRGIDWTPTYVGFLLYIFVIVTYRLGIATAFMGLALVGLAFQRSRLRVPTFLVLLIASLAWASLGSLGSDYRPIVFEALIDRGKVCLITLVAVSALRTRPQLRFFLLFLLASYMLFPIRSVLVNYITGYRVFGRAVGPYIYQNSNDLAALALLALAVAIVVFTIERRSLALRWGAIAAIILLLVTVLLTKSRGGFLALAVMVGPPLVTQIRRRPKTLLSAAALGVVVVLIAPADTWDRFLRLRLTTREDEISQFDPEGSALQRLQVLGTAVRIVADQPLFGVGLGAYPLANARYNPALGQKDTHNTYLNLAAEVGIPGLALFVAMVVSVLRHSWRMRRRVDKQRPDLAHAQRWLEVGLIAYLAAGIFGSFSKLTFPYVFMAIVWCHAETIRQLLPPAASPRGRR